MARRAAARLTWSLLAVLLVLALLASRAFLRWQYPLFYEETIWHHAELNDLDPMLVAAVIRVESRFRPDAVSSRGALGLMQVMPETGKWIAAQLGIDDFSPEMLLDPYLNIRLGTWYLRELREEFGGDTVLTLAAYNGGRGRVREWVREAGWDLSRAAVGRFPSELIPYAETRTFVNRVLRDHLRYQVLYGCREPDR